MHTGRPCPLGPSPGLGVPDPTAVLQKGLVSWAGAGGSRGWRQRRPLCTVLSLKHPPLIAHVSEMQVKAPVTNGSILATSVQALLEEKAQSPPGVGRESP